MTHLRPVAASAGAQIPLTDRESASAVVFLTAQQAMGKGATDIAWFAAVGATLLIYMPNGRYREIAEQAMAAGLSPRTPCLIVSNASCRQQQMQWTDIAGLALLSQPEAPAILIVGEVASCPEEVIPAIALHALQEVRSEIQTQNTNIGGEH